jgi:DNA modification methylase
MNVIDQTTAPDWQLYNGDSIEVIRGIPERSIGLAVYSPPFSSLYTYSGSCRDLGNSADDAEFIRHYEFLAREIFRVLRPGRLCAVHCKDLVDYAGSDEQGEAGLRDFPGDLIRCHERAGFKFHSRITIWKCPKREMQRTKAHGLLFKQLRADSSFSRSGLAEYVLLFRRWAKEADEVAPVTHTADDFPLSQWQEWASPVWMNIVQTDVLNVAEARSDRDEKHMCPLQLDLVERVVRLWSNSGDVVLSPFAGIGSEGYVALRAGRKFVGVELKPEYYRQALRNLGDANRQLTFGQLLAAE